MSLVQEKQLVCDVLVAGGGPAGVPCAIAAARSGARVILCHDRPVLGGNSSSEIRMHMVGADGGGGRGEELRTEAREGGIIEEIRLEACVRNPQRSPSMADLILYDKCRAEPNLTLMLNTAVTRVVMQDGRIAEALAERPSTEDRFRIRAGIFIDCTGDGRMALEAGAPYRFGREGAGEFGESLAPQLADEKVLGSTLLFQARNTGQPCPFVAPSWARKFTEEDLKLRPHASPGLDHGLEYGYWWVEWGGCLDTIKENEQIRDELLAIVMGVWDHVKNGGSHGAENWALDWFGFLPGKRESRRFLGQHILTERDVLESSAFPDAIAYGGWAIDIHPPEGVDAPDKDPCEQNHVPYLYDIPLRACVALGVPNLMFAGRNFSATHVAFASTRVMATCAVVGQAAGTAAALAIREGVAPADIAANPELIKRIQQRLLRDDCFLIGLRNEDPADHARSARVSASSCQSGGEPEQVLSGQTRCAHGERGVPPQRSNPATHRWMSDGMPAWLEFDWEEPIAFSEVQLIFDTGLHRVLTLSNADGYVEKMIWGRPQPETVRDYRIEAWIGGAWEVLCSESGNYQRRRVHAFSRIESKRLRVVVTATNGMDHARICEVRVY